jgi:excisionase family DNA binding protein
MSGKGAEISPEEAAVLLGVHPRTVRNLISRKKVVAAKVNGKWYIDKASVLNLAPGEADAALPKIPPKSHIGPRILAPYRLCLHAFEQFDWQFEAPAHVQARIPLLQLAVLENLGAGFYAYGDEKKRHYRAARAALGGLLGIIHPYRDKNAGVSKAIEFLEEECVSATASLIRKLERKRAHEITTDL